MTFRRFLLDIAPVLIWIGVIFTLSTRAGSAAHTNSSLDIFLSRFFPRFYHHLTANQLDSLHYSLRKCAHLTEYAILGILTMRAVRRSRFASITRAAISRPVVLTSWAFCALYAATDEFHQIFVPGRTPEVTDALLDSLGAAIGIALYIAFARRQRARGAQ